MEKMGFRKKNGYTVKYKIYTNKFACVEHNINICTSEEEINFLVKNGYLVIENLFSENHVDIFRNAVDRVMQQELSSQDAEFPLDGKRGQQLRGLLYKDSAFLPLFNFQPTLSIARAVLGPQIQFENVDARVALPGIKGQNVPWHMHLNKIPDPIPPFFCYPHSLHFLLYLDDVQENEGLLCVLPGSHMITNYMIQPTDDTDKPGQVNLSIKAGTCLIMHPKLWHRTLPANEKSHIRRVLIFSYAASWLRRDESIDAISSKNIIEKLKITGDKETRELLGEFEWR